MASACVSRLVTWLAITVPVFQGCASAIPGCEAFAGCGTAAADAVVGADGVGAESVGAEAASDPDSSGPDSDADGTPDDLGSADATAQDGAALDAAGADLVASPDAADADTETCSGVAVVGAAMTGILMGSYCSTQCNEDGNPMNDLAYPGVVLDLACGSTEPSPVTAVQALTGLSLYRGCDDGIEVVSVLRGQCSKLTGVCGSTATEPAPPAVTSTVQKYSSGKPYTGWGACGPDCDCLTPSAQTAQSCPAGTVAVGFRGFAGKYVQRLQLLCAQVVAGAGQVGWSTWVAAEGGTCCPKGTVMASSDPAFTCPKDAILAGLDGDAHVSLKFVRGYCLRLAAAE